MANWLAQQPVFTSSFGGHTRRAGVSRLLAAVAGLVANRPDRHGRMATDIWILTANTGRARSVQSVVPLASPGEIICNKACQEREQHKHRVQPERPQFGFASNDQAHQINCSDRYSKGKRQADGLRSIL